MSAYDDQEKMFEGVMEEARILTSDASQLTHLETFLDNINERIKPCRVQFINSKIGVRWDCNSGYISVLFGSDNDWEWVSESTNHYGSNKHYTYNDKYWFSGGPSYVRTDNSVGYWLPTRVLDLIKVPDIFEETYEPMIEKHEREIVWVTSKYDGMLAGYCRYNGKLHLFEHVEETEFERNRMFAVFELSLLERTKVWMRYHVWHTILYNRVLWNLHTYKWRMSIKWRLFRKSHIETYGERIAKLEKTHKIVGYFQG